MHFNYVRTFFRFHLPFSFNVFLPIGESNPGHPAYAVGIPQSSFVIMRLYSFHSSLPSVACHLPFSQPSPNVRLPVAVHCLHSNGARQCRQPETPSSTLLGVTTHDWRRPITVFLRQHCGSLRLAAFSKRSPSGRRPLSGIHARQVFRNPTKPEFPAALFSQPFRQTPSNL